VTTFAPPSVRRHVFGRDPAGYDRVRLRYPPRVYEILAARCGLGPGAAVFEIGPGTGIATRELLRRGVSAITLIEPDRRMARFLLASLGARGRRATLLLSPFEKANLPRRSFDLGVAASSFHWLPPRASLRKVARALKPGGWWAEWGNQHNDGDRPSPFYRALEPLYRDLSGGRARPRGRRVSAAGRRALRVRTLRSLGVFDRISVEEIRWTARLSSAHARALWSTFSEIATLPPGRRERFLGALERLVDERFGGTVAVPIRTPLYLARTRERAG
jgi:SAM-dependent methyltransferase